MDMKQMMRQAQKMQAELAKAQEEIKTMTAEATAGGGMVKVVAQKTAVRGSAVTVSHVVENMMSSLLLGVGERLH